MSIEEAHAVVDEFCRAYPSTRALQFVIRETQEDLYGPQASKDAVGTILGGYVPGTVDRHGRFRAGRCDIPVANVDSAEELGRTLRHELLGHFGLGTFEPGEKRALLTAISEARADPDLSSVWAHVDREYASLVTAFPPQDAELRKAEEVYATVSEAVTSIDVAHVEAGRHALRETCIEQSRQMSAVDVVCISQMVAAGLADRSRAQQTFPQEPDAQFPPAKELHVAKQDSPTDTLRKRLRGEPSVTPEDTHSELLEDEQTARLRSRLTDNTRPAPEDTQAELREAVAREVAPSSDELVSDQAMQRRRLDEERREAARDDELAEAWERVEERRGENTRESGQPRFVEPGARRADRSDQELGIEEALARQRVDEQRRLDAHEKDLSGQGLHTVDLRINGKELGRGEFLMPRRLLQTYTEVDGKFYAKDTNRVVFEDKGDRLATSTTDDKAIDDMIAYAQAKQWTDLKLGGSQEFRRKGWLQAESRGIRTIGYTPKGSDLAALETLRQERATNAITPVEQRGKNAKAASAPAPAPRHDMNKSQASLHAEAMKTVTSNVQALRERPAFADRSMEDLTRLAYWRGIVAEENKGQPDRVRDEAVARFDTQAEDPQFLRRIEQQTDAGVKEKTSSRVQQRDTHEQVL